MRQKNEIQANLIEYLAAASVVATAGEKKFIY